MLDFWSNFLGSEHAKASLMPKFRAYGLEISCTRSQVASSTSATTVSLFGLFIH